MVRNHLLCLTLIASPLLAGTAGQNLELRPSPRPGPEIEAGSRLSEESRLKVESIVAAVREEITGLGTHHWAGEYYAGDGFGSYRYLYLAPEAGFAFEWHGGLGLYDRNWGTVERQGEWLVLRPTLANEHGNLRGAPERLRWVQWGERTHLVPEDELAGFCAWLSRREGPGVWLEFRDRDLELPPRRALPVDLQECWPAE